jgi:hypothetical protein
LPSASAPLPGVAKAASVSDLPMGWRHIGGSFDVEGHAWQPGNCFYGGR